ncbi:type II toxin-antitoxin system CcdA family antitoxin [Psychromarinibacter sp. C21-152]|uniref:Type II toxin-antitoxin system CcdA family antitoxin n=1 Tax=Psychromarinibacter sediminicola TaxID=3033385 RepID=A0AAE3NVK9_9RHOB|nr:type II toxin-antitoxin system CcdA family antitoxin [Psychromarinibacter sediminicola]MDF0601442.1 type II toxin-antitoxin system CcdA family antitoxin [Psychromarinibacter sediminicola]
MSTQNQTLIVSLDADTLSRAQELGIDISAAAERGLRAAILAKTYCAPDGRGKDARTLARATLDAVRARAHAKHSNGR